MPRVAIFHNKGAGYRIQGYLSPEGGRRFEAARVRLGHLFQSIMGRPAAVVSDADTAEYLARGDSETRAYLEARR